MQTLLMTEIVNLTGFQTSRTLPDHSIIIGTFNTLIFDIMKNENHKNNMQFQTFNDFQVPTRKPKKRLKKYK